MIDGTACNQNGFNKCVNGVCIPAGCDNKLYSDTKLNKCATCHSSNEICKDIHGTFSPEQIVLARKINEYLDYFHVVKIPKGAANIEIIQIGYAMDESYIGEIGFWISEILILSYFGTFSMYFYSFSK